MKILIVEDDPLYAQTLARLLDGVRTHVAGTLAAARAALDLDTYQLILLDLGLPDSHGIDTLRALSGYAVPKVVVTGSYDITAEGAGLGVVDYIVKTSDMTDIFDRIMFNVNKLARKRVRFAPEVFQQIKACLVRPHAAAPV